MSRENKQNPGQYTQAGRLTPDDAAREYAKQRQSSHGRHGSANPRSRSEAWMRQAEQARALSVRPPAQEREPAWSEQLTNSLGAASVALGAVGMLAGRRLARTPGIRNRQATLRTAAFVLANGAAVALSVYVASRLAAAGARRLR